MAPPVPSALPSVLHVATTWRWTRAPADFPAADGWTLRARFIGPTSADNLTVTATNVGGLHQFDAAPTVTANLGAGSYRVITTAELAGDVFPVDTVFARIQPDPETQAPDSFATHNERCLAAIEAAIEQRLSGGAVQAYTIAGRQLQYATLDELEKMRGLYVARVKRERGGSVGYVVSAQFGSSRGRWPTWP